MNNGKSDVMIARLRKAPPGLPVFPLCAFVSFVVKLSARRVRGGLHGACGGLARCVRRARTVRAKGLHGACEEARTVRATGSHGACAEVLWTSVICCGR
jgi:hypothetical protein